MLLLRPPVIRELPAVKAPVAPATATLDTPARPEQAPARPVRTAPQRDLAAHGQAAWQSALNFISSLGLSGANAEFAAMVLVKVARDVTVVELKAGKELPLLHPVFAALGPFLNERGREIPFSQVAAEALNRRGKGRFSIFSVGGELIARSPSWRYAVSLRAILPQSWHAAVKTMGQQAMSEPKLNRFHYEAKLYLITASVGQGSPESSRIMIQSRRREAGQMRQFKGDRESWLQAAE